ncbi:MAG TPA: hypothetical protein VIB48_18460 [Acidimicrobiia bacterium]
MERFGAIAVIRAVMVVLFAGLAATSFVSGRVLAGVLFAGLAAANVALVVAMHRRRRALTQRFPQLAQRRGRRDVA